MFLCDIWWINHGGDGWLIDEDDGVWWLMNWWLWYSCYVDSKIYVLCTISTYYVIYSMMVDVRQMASIILRRGVELR